jgi:hypothetical protein
LNQEQINKDLQKESSDFQKKVLSTCRAYLFKSGTAMTSLYDKWDTAERLYRGYRLDDKDDVVAKAKGQPPKIIIPVTYAQTQTVISFLMQQFASREYFYEFRPTSWEAAKGAEALAIDIQYQLTHSLFPYRQYCFMLDVIKYGFGVMKCEWRERFQKMRTRKEVAPSGLAAMGAALGFNLEKKFEESVEDVLSYQGNELTNISPYHFFTDTSVSLANFQKGQFAAHSEEKSRTELRKDEGKFFFGTDKIPEGFAMEDVTTWNHRGFEGYGSATGFSAASLPIGKEKSSSVILTEIIVHLVPKKYKEEYDVDIGDEDVPVKFLVVIANATKIIKFERYGYLHDQFPYVVGEFSPDSNSFYNPGMPETIKELQEMVSFMMNSHILNVKSMIQNRFIADPSKINIDDVKNNSVVIRLLQSGLPIDKVIQQLQQHDVTSSHIKDSDTLLRFIQLTTGINENALGQFAGGRRSATEARNVGAGASARLKLYSTLLWTMAFEPLGRLLLANTRQGRSPEVWQAILGQKLSTEAPFEQVVLANPSQLAGGYDLLPYDSTLPSEKVAQAGFLKELLVAGLSNPQAFAAFQLNPIKLLDQMALLMGVKQLENARITPEELQQEQQKDQQQQQQADQREVEKEGAIAERREMAKRIAQAPMPEMQVVPDNAIPQGATPMQIPGL